MYVGRFHSQISDYITVNLNIELPIMSQALPPAHNSAQSSVLFEKYAFSFTRLQNPLCYLVVVFNNLYCNYISQLQYYSVKI